MEALLLSRGVDAILSRHIAHLFIRDPLVIFQDALRGEADNDSGSSTDHFETIQSTNWQSVRWKPPPPTQGPLDPRIGWRTELRTMEIQLTDFENAAFTVFVVLLTRIILAFDLHLYIPISKLDENMRRAHARDGVHTQKFFFRKYMATDGEEQEEGAKEGGREGAKAPGLSHCLCEEVQEYEEMTISEIMTGKSTYFPGLIPLCYAYLEYIECDSHTGKKVGQYLELVRRRATGEVMTAASYMRNFVQEHPEYKHDSVISQSIAVDLMQHCHDVGTGAAPAPELLGHDVRIERVSPKQAYDARLSSTRLLSHERANVIARYFRRDSFYRRHGSSEGGDSAGGGGGLEGSGSFSSGSFLSPSMSGSGSLP